MPPRKSRFVLLRPRLVQRMHQAVEYRLTVIRAGTGYGKSTVLSMLAEGDVPSVWYQLSPEDSDPLTFISHLVVALDEHLGGLSPIPMAQLEEWEQNRQPAAGMVLVDVLVNEAAERLKEPLFLVLDDAHLLNQSDETMRLLNRFLSHAPSNLHTVCATRHPLDLQEIVMWRMYGELLEIDQAELAFTPDEIAQLFSERYDLDLNPADLNSLHEQIEGWPIALPLIWQNLQKTGNGDDSVQQSLEKLAGSDNLFHYLTREVVNQQTAEVQSFLKHTAVLRLLSESHCNRLCGTDNGREILDYLRDYGLFVVPLEKGGLRYHHLFRDVLLNLNEPEEAQRLHVVGAELMLQEGAVDEAVYHLLAAEEYDQAAQLVAKVGRTLVTEGRLDTLLGWIRKMPPQLLDEYPILEVYLGHIERLHSRFDQALDYYRHATTRLRESGNVDILSYALYSQARVYLDTINPVAADKLLQEASLLIGEIKEPDAYHQQIYDLIIENQLNRGSGQIDDNAELLPYPLGTELQARLLLRTGRLREARQLLLKQLREEQSHPVYKPRAHREPLLLLTLTYSLLGEQAEAEQAAAAAMQRGEKLDSYYITAVATSRLGLGHLIRRTSEGDDLARQKFEEAIDLSDRLLVPRLKLLALWGQCQAYGYKGDVAYARQIGTEAITMARKAGDRWIQAGVELFLGASYVLNGDGADALGWINQAEESFEESGDKFGETCASMWRCLVLDSEGAADRLNQELQRFLNLVIENRYEFLFSKNSLYGPPSPRILIPLLLKAKFAGLEAAVANGVKKDEQAIHASVVASKILEGLNLHKIDTHPGYQLKVKMFGNFQVWQGDAEIKPSDWKRQKARQLFQLLVTQAGSLMEREQIIDTLWPELDDEGGQRDFKIAYTTLTKVLEPERGRKAPSAYVTRDASRYGLLLFADVMVDSYEFDRLVTTGDRVYPTQPEAALDYYTDALKLYEGEYLQEYPYEEWADEERRRLQSDWLRTAERVGHVRILQGDWLGAGDIGQQVLAQDNCWEPAWRMVIQAEFQLGNRSNALRLYNDCEEALASEMGISPGPETFKLYERISGKLSRRQILIKGESSESS